MTQLIHYTGDKIIANTQMFFQSEIKKRTQQKKRIQQFEMMTPRVSLKTYPLKENNKKKGKIE